MKTEVAARKIKLWFLNDEQFYRYVEECMRFGKNRDEVVQMIVPYCKAVWGETTPDNAPINKTNVRFALRNWCA